ncbi:hypothetical protein GJU90_02455 [Brucella sp. 10RB9210]|nr:hypothetical protein BKD03_05850 [Brucella sp. 09RB8471]MRN77274.1 hypothetical protein [Brucella sp. 10RB9210]
MTRKCSRTVPVLTESPEPLYLFGFTHYPTQNRFAFLARKCSSGACASGGPRSKLQSARGCGRKRKARSRPPVDM